MNWGTKDSNDVLDTFQNSVEQWVALGDTFHERNYREKALAAYERAIHLDPNSATACIGKGNVLLSLNRYEEALIAFNQAIQVAPDNFQVYFEKGFSLEYMGSYEEALAVYELALQLSPNNVDIYSRIGDILFELQRFEKAIEAYDQAFSLEPKSCYYYKKGCSFAKLQQYEKAIEILAKYIFDKPDDYYGHYEIGTAYLALGYSEEAVTSYKQVISLNAHLYSSINVGNELCTLLCKLNRFEEALALCDEGIASYYIIGCIFFELKRYEEASEAFKQSLYKDYRNADIWIRWGNTFERLGKPERARRCYKEADYIYSHPKQPNREASSWDIAQIINELIDGIQ